MEVCTLRCRYAASHASAKKTNYLSINAHGPWMHSYRKDNCWWALETPVQGNVNKKPFYYYFFFFFCKEYNILLVASFNINNYFCVCWKIGKETQNYSKRISNKPPQTAGAAAVTERNITRLSFSCVAEYCSFSVEADMTDRRRCFLAHWFRPWFHKLLVSELQEPTECSTFTQK